MKKLIYIIVGLFVLMGCSPKIRYVTLTQTDTLFIKEIVRDTIIPQVLPVEKIEVITKDTISNLETSVAKSTAAIKEGFLQHSLENKDSILVKTEIKEVERVVVKEKEVEVPVPKIVKETVKPWYLKYLVVYLLCSGVYFASKLIKFLRKINLKI